MGRNSRLLVSALLTIAGAILPNAAEAGAVSTATTLALSSPSVASPAAVDSHGHSHSHSGRCTRSRRHGDLLQCRCDLL